MASIARKNLVEHPIRLLIAQAGILFAVGLVILQTGIYTGFTRSVSFLIANSSADIWVASSSVVHLGLTLPLPYEDLANINQIKGIDRTEALIFRAASWRNNQAKLSAITLIGLNPDGQLFYPLSTVEGQLKSLQTPYAVFVDKTSLNPLDVKAVGDLGAVASLPARIRGLTQGTQSLVLGPTVFSSLESALAYTTTPISGLPCSVAAQGVSCTTFTNFPPRLRALRTGDPISYILVRVGAGENISQIQQNIEKTLPNTRALTRSEMVQQNRDYWTQRSNIGFILGLGGIVGVIVGIVVVGQILYASVSDNIREFATLKAIGGTNNVIYRIIGEQALWMAIIGYIPGLGISIGISKWAAAAQGLLILITPLSAFYVFGVTVLMCLTAALFAIRKVTRLDPATVFRG